MRWSTSRPRSTGITAQDYRRPYEVILAVRPERGRHERRDRRDGRRRSAGSAASRTSSDRRPAGSTSRIRASRYPDRDPRRCPLVSFRTDYTRIAVRVLGETGADNVGGIMHAVGRTSFEKAVARAYGSREGLGGTPLHVGGNARDRPRRCTSACSSRPALEVGLFDEEHQARPGLGAQPADPREPAARCGSRRSSRWSTVRGRACAS